MKPLLIDELTELASRAEPPPLDDVTARRMIERAMRAPRAITHAAPSRWRYIAPAIAAIAIVAILAWPRGTTPVVTAEPPIQVTLPTGDRLVGTAGARFELGELAPASRKITLHGGTMLFDVARVVDGQRFEVAIGGATIVATGTVFSVGVEPAAERVQVYEGRVEVHHAGHIERLAAGETWSSGVASIDPTPIVEAAQQAVIARAASPTGQPVKQPSTVAMQPATATQPMPAAHAAIDAPGPSTSTQPRPAAQPASTAPNSSAPTQPAAGNAPTSSTSLAQPTSSTRQPASSKAPNSSAPSTEPAASKSPLPTQPAASKAPPANTVASSIPGRVETSKPPRVASVDDALALAHTDLGAGRYQAALDRATGRSDAAWLLVIADAHRGLGHALLAADTYDRAAKLLAASDRATAGYNAAYLRFRELRDPAGALVSLQTAGVDADDSPLEERGLALAVQLMVALHREADARPLAKRYLKRFPRGDLVAMMNKLAKD